MKQIKEKSMVTRRNTQQQPLLVPLYTEKQHRSNRQIPRQPGLAAHRFSKKVEIVTDRSEVGKRQRSKDDDDEESKPSSNLDTIQKELQICVIDRSQPDGSMTA